MIETIKGIMRAFNELYFKTIILNAIINFCTNILSVFVCFWISFFFVFLFSDISICSFFVTSGEIFISFISLTPSVFLLYLLTIIVYYKFFYSKIRRIKKSARVIQLENNKTNFVDTSLILVFFTIIVLISTNSLNQSESNQIELLCGHYLGYIIALWFFKSIRDSLSFNNISNNFLECICTRLR